jgi:DNA (cytosine-5)-methyltransferase 1
MRTVALCEIEAFACANLVAKMEAGLMDPAPIWTDLKTFPYEQFHGKVDVLTGGYPCQPFSSAGKRLGKDDPRHLWPYIADGIRVMRPRVCFFENVEGHISLGLSTVISDLEEMGYSVSWGIFSASEVSAPHQRKRVFILAQVLGSGMEGGIAKLCVPKGREVSSGHSSCSCGPRGAQCVADSDFSGGWKDRKSSEQRAVGTQQPPSDSWRMQAGEVCKRQAWPSRPSEPQHAWEPPRVLGNSNRLNWRAQTEGRQHNTKSGSTSEGMGDSEGRDGQWSAQRQAGHTAQSNQGSVIREAQPSLGGDADGSADWMGYAELYESCDNRTDELRLLGNGVVPATAEKAFITLINEQNDIT